MEVAFTSLPVCRFYSLRVHFCTFDASLFFTLPAWVDRICARLPASSRNFCLTVTMICAGSKEWMQTDVLDALRDLFRNLIRYSRLDRREVSKEAAGRHKRRGLGGDSDSFRGRYREDYDVG